MGLFSWVMKGFGIEKKKEDNRRPISHVPSAVVTPEVPQASVESGAFDLRNFSAPTLFADGFSQPQSQLFGQSQSGGKSLSVTSPHTYQDIQMLIENLQRGNPCIISLEALDPTDAQRKLDFLSGALYSLGGSIKTLQPNLYAITPSGMGINGVPQTQPQQQVQQPQQQQMQMQQPQFVSNYGAPAGNYPNGGGNGFGGGSRY